MKLKINYAKIFMQRVTKGVNPVDMDLHLFMFWRRKMEEIKQNNMAVKPLKKLMWSLGLPMIVSMVLQALYNVVDSIFVANIKDIGAIANEALTYAFPIQILMIAIGVGTGVGVNSLLSKNLGENNKEEVNKIAGNAIFIAIVIYIVFLLFGLFGTNWFISLFTSNSHVIEMGSSYLRICCVFSLGSIGFAIYERFLQSTGKTLYSTIAQISGAVINIIFDYVFIFPLGLNVNGAALATIFGQFVSLGIAMLFHYLKNKEINGNLKYLHPDKNIIKGIYSIGISAAIMQGLLSVMMAGMNAILASSSVDSTILVGAFGIYYKIQQIALFSCFGLSNTIITVLSFNYGLKNKQRSLDAIKYGIFDSILVALIITIVFEIIARPLSLLFALSGGETKSLIDVCERAVRIASIGYVFMAISVSIQGVFQALRNSLFPLITALLRLVVFVFPLAYIFTLSEDVLNIVWFTFPIAEVLTSIISVILLKYIVKKKIYVISDDNEYDNLIITISREHGTNGKRIAKLVAEKLNIDFYDKELLLDEAKKLGFYDRYISEFSNEDGYSLYLSLDANKNAIIAQSEIIKELAKTKSFVIVGRCADYILKNNKKLLTVFLYANLDYRVNNIIAMYGDSKEEALQNIKRSDAARKKYYALISNREFSNKNNYDLYIDASMNIDEIVNIIVSEALKK